MLLDIQNDISLEKNQLFVGKTLKVLVDKMGSNILVLVALNMIHQKLIILYI